MIEKPFDEYFYWKCHQLSLFSATMKDNMGIGYFYNSTIGNGAPTKITGQIGDDTITMAILLADLDIPFLTAQLI